MGFSEAKDRIVSSRFHPSGFWPQLRRLHFVIMVGSCFTWRHPSGLGLVLHVAKPRRTGANEKTHFNLELREGNRK